MTSRRERQQWQAGTRCAGFDPHCASRTFKQFALCLRRCDILLDYCPFLSGGKPQKGVLCTGKRMCSNIILKIAWLRCLFSCQERCHIVEVQYKREISAVMLHLGRCDGRGGFGGGEAPIAATAWFLRSARHEATAFCADRLLQAVQNSNFSSQPARLYPNTHSSRSIYYTVARCEAADQHDAARHCQVAQDGSATNASH